MKTCLRSSSALGLAVSTTAMATLARDIRACRVDVMGDEFPAIQRNGKAGKECAGDGATADSNLAADHQPLNISGLTGNPIECTSATIANFCGYRRRRDRRNVN